MKLVQIGAALARARGIPTADVQVGQTSPASSPSASPAAIP